MGGGSSSIYQQSRQEIATNIAQISRANCINTCVTSSGFDIKIQNSYFKGNINSSESCFIQGASCALKSALDSTLINDQTSKQKGSIERELDLFTFLAGGISDNITQENLQRISNDITQIIDSTCQNKAESDSDPYVLELVNTTFEGDVNIESKKSISNVQCVVDNLIKNYVENKQTNDQDASIKITGSLGSILMILFIILILYLMIRYGGFGKGGGGKGGISEEKLADALVKAQEQEQGK